MRPENAAKMTEQETSRRFLGVWGSAAMTTFFEPGAALLDIPAA